MRAAVISSLRKGHLGGRTSLVDDKTAAFFLRQQRDETAEPVRAMTVCEVVDELLTCIWQPGTRPWGIPYDSLGAGATAEMIVASLIVESRTLCIGQVGLVGQGTVGG